MTLDQAEAVARAANLDVRVIATSPLGQGVKSVVSRIELEDAEPLALKVFLRGGHTSREHDAYRLLGDHSIAMPRMLDGVAETADFPFGYTLLTMAPGEPLNLNFGGLPRARLLAVYRGVGELQAALHVAPITTALENAEVIADRVSEALGIFLTHGGSHRLAGRLENYFAANAERFRECREPVLCHGDLHPENIFVSGDATSLKFRGAIDLEESFIGDPVMDLTRTIQSCPLPGDDLTAALLEGYGGKPAGFDERHDAYFALYELELWNYYAQGGSRKPLRSIARRLRRRIRSG